MPALHQSDNLVSGVGNTIAEEKLAQHHELAGCVSYSASLCGVMFCGLLRLAVAHYAKQATTMPESPRGSIRRGAASRQGSRALPDVNMATPSSPSIVTVNSNTWDIMARLGTSPHHFRRATQ